MVKRALLTFFLLATACGSSAPLAPTGIAGTLVQFVVPRGGQMPDFFALPFPSDLRLKDDGTVDLRGFPTGRRADVLRGYLETIQATTRGWGTNGAMYFRFGGAIDPSSLPANAAASIASDASVFLIDIDPDSPKRGTRIPIDTHYYATAKVYIPANVLALLPVTGVTLRGRTRYAAVVTRRVRDATGAELGSPADFEVIKASKPSTDPALEKARTVYGPAFTELEALGVPRDQIAGLAVFTTQDPTAELIRMRAFVNTQVAAPEAKQVTCTSESRYIRCTGEYDTPNFQAGVPPYQSSGGQFEFASNGDPIVQRTETIPFTLTLPKIDPPAGGFPIALVAHGTTGTRNSFLGTNDTGDVLARQGVAAIGIDQPLHGARDDFCPAATRDDCQSLWTFNPSNIVAARDNHRQGVVDNFYLMRLVMGLVIPAVTAGASADVRFDPARILFFGHSQGANTGAIFIGVEPDVKGAVLSGGGGKFGLALVLKDEPIDIKATIELLLGIEGENELELFHPIITAFQMFMERTEPLNFAAGYVAEPPAGGAPKHVMITEGLGDSYTPNLATEALAVAAGANPVAPVLHEVDAFSLLGRSVLSPDVSNNASGPGGATATVVLAQYPESSSDGHFVVYYNATARMQYANFLGSLAKTGTATFMAP